MTNRKNKVIPAKVPQVLPTLKTFSDTVKYFKDKEAVEDALCLIEGGPALDSDSLRRIVIAWPKVRIVRKIVVEESPLDDYELWRWVWSQVDYDVDEIGRISGTGRSAADLMEVLLGNRILYPDGTVSSWAQKVVRQVFKTHLNI